MLEIDIDNDPTVASQTVASFMFFPSSESDRRSWVVVNKAYALLHVPHSADSNVYLSLIEQLVDAKARPELNIQKERGIKRGLVAGDILASLYLMDRFKLGEPGLRSAMAVSRYFAKETVYGDGEKMNQSNGEIQKIWFECKSVSHLWAAWRLNQDYAFATNNDLLGKDIVELLNAAETIRIWALQFTQKRMDKPLFADGDFLRFKTPWAHTPLHINATEKPDRLAAYIKKYSADQKK